MRKHERQHLLWARSYDTVSAAFKQSATGWAEAQAELKRLREEREQLLWKIDLLTRACDGGDQMRRRLKAENESLKTELEKLRAENREINETLDMISAENNGELIRQLYGKRA